MTKSLARHLLARCRGIEPAKRESEGSCAMCGLTPFETAGPKRRVLGSNFVDFMALLEPLCDDICAGCDALMSGRPGDDPPPLRTRSVYADESGARYLKMADIWPLIEHPPANRFTLSWAESGQKHHWLHAEMSTPQLLRIGCDRTTIEFDRSRHDGLRHAVAEMIARGSSRKAIILGDYHPKTVRTVGSATWRRLELMIEPHRPSPLLDFLTTIAPKPDDVATLTDEVQLIDPQDQKAAEILAGIARSSSVRTNDGKMFWGGFFRHRVERYRRCSLPDLASKLMDAVQSSTTSPEMRTTIAAIEEMDDDTQQAVQSAIADRPAFIISLAYEQIQKAKS